MSSVFVAPSWLWLLLLLVPLVVWDLGRPWPVGRGRRFAAVFARLAGATALVLALAGPRLHYGYQAADVVYVIDRSASVPDAALQGALDDVDALRRWPTLRSAALRSCLAMSSWTRGRRPGSCLRGLMARRS